MKCWRIKAAKPEIAGVEWLVPSEAVYHCCPAGKKFEPTPPQTPVALKQVSWVPVPLPAGLAMEFCGAPPETCVPGATISGLRRPSDVGPRLEKAIMSFALSAPAF